MKPLPFSQQLRERSRVAWDRIRTHPFVTALGDGTLSLGRFRYFMRQDYLFLIEYSRVLAVAAAKSPDLESMGRFAGLLDETLHSEMALHRGFCADFGITRAELEMTRAAPATVAYTKFLLETAFETGIEEICAVLLPCQWSYDEIGRSLAATTRAPLESFHRRWIDGYNSPEYQQVTAWLIGFVDRLGSEADRATRAGMHGLFAESCRHELEFWDAALRFRQR